MQEHQWFGTDGIRGRCGSEAINPAFCIQLAQACAVVMKHYYPMMSPLLNVQSLLSGASVMDASLPTADYLVKHSAVDETAEQLAARQSLQARARYAVVLGRDTRASGPALLSALAAGFAAVGVEVYDVGVVPTPAVAQLTRELGALLGVMVSASHNSYHDNGIKLFNGYGFKLDDGLELEIEKVLRRGMPEINPDRCYGQVYTMPSQVLAHYRQRCAQLFAVPQPLQGYKIVVDCAHGASYKLLPMILQDLGAEVLTFAAKPDGFNINHNCGTEHADTLRMLMLTHQEADVGIALDGDGDRLLMADKQGQLYNGDAILYILASHPRAGQHIKGVVGTDMTNLGLELALAKHGVELLRAQVGDRYVLQLLQKQAWQLGGESSGHIMDLGIMTSGDATMIALSILRVMLDSQQDLATLCAGLQLCRQQLSAIPYQNAIDLQDASLLKALRAAEQLLGEQGRVLLRYSGTEPVLRLMVEGHDQAAMQQAGLLVQQAITQLME